MQASIAHSVSKSRPRPHDLPAWVVENAYWSAADCRPAHDGGEMRPVSKRQEILCPDFATSLKLKDRLHFAARNPRSGPTPASTSSSRSAWIWPIGEIFDRLEGRPFHSIFPIIHSINNCFLLYLLFFNGGIFHSIGGGENPPFFPHR